MACWTPGQTWMAESEQSEPVGAAQCLSQTLCLGSTKEAHALGMTRPCTSRTPEDAELMHTAMRARRLATEIAGRHDT